MGGVLDGVRVLDFGRYIAGPFVGCMLADLGAEVIRVEKVDGSEDRYTAPVGEGAEGEPMVGAGFLQLNRNKLGIALNPMKPEGRELVKKLVATADVVLANLPIETLTAMGLNYEALCEIKPDIILTMSSAFGATGPYANRVGFDGVAQALCGNMHLSGHADEPMKSWVPWVDYGTALSSTIGTLAALMHKAKTGEGQLVEGTLLGTSLTFNNTTLIEEAILKVGRVGSGNRGQGGAPVDAFKCSDGWILVQIVGQPLFERWARLMGEDHWLTDPRFATDQDRGDNGIVVSERMQAWCAERSTAEAIAALEEARIPCGEVYEPARTLKDRHIDEAQFFKHMEYPGVPGDYPVMDTQFRMSKSDVGVKRRSPLLGEHTEQILAGIGVDAAELARLREARVVR